VTKLFAVDERKPNGPFEVAKSRHRCFNVWAACLLINKCGPLYRPVFLPESFQLIQGIFLRYAYVSLIYFFFAIRQLKVIVITIITSVGQMFITTMFISVTTGCRRNRGSVRGSRKSSDKKIPRRPSWDLLNTTLRNHRCLQDRSKQKSRIS